jgi:hypothetical protein
MVSPKWLCIDKLLQSLLRTPLANPSFPSSVDVGHGPEGLFLIIIFFALVVAAWTVSAVIPKRRVAVETIIFHFSSWFVADVASGRIKNRPMLISLRTKNEQTDIVSTKLE